MDSREPGGTSGRLMRGRLDGVDWIRGFGLGELLAQPNQYLPQFAAAHLTLLLNSPSVTRYDDLTSLHTGFRPNCTFSLASKRFSLVANDSPRTVLQCLEFLSICH